jgi:hypothetical protein
MSLVLCTTFISYLGHLWLPYVMAYVVGCITLLVIKGGGALTYECTHLKQRTYATFNSNGL